MFNTLLTNSTRPRPFILCINYYNEEYGSREKLETTMEAFQEFRNTDSDIEENWNSNKIR